MNRLSHPLLHALRAPRKTVLGLLIVLVAHACSGADPSSGKPSSVTFVAPTPAPVSIFWIDSAGNLGLRGVVAIVPGAPAPVTDPPDPRAGKLSDACRASATVNGDGTLTVCMEKTVGRVLAEKLGLDWTSGTSTKP